MNGIRVLVSPLSWGFGHAGRMIPLALALRSRGCEVVFAADPPLLRMVEKELPGIRTVEVPGLRIRYSRHLPQYICIFLQLPRIIASGIREHRVLRRLVRELNPSLIISDNRFGFYNRKVYSVYITHQLRIPFPGLLRFMEPLAAWLHRMIINRYDLCLVPDYPGNRNLSGRLSHQVRLPRNISYMGPLSRFAGDDGREVSDSGNAAGGKKSGSAGMTGTCNPPSHSDKEGSAGMTGNPYICLILSGPEPQRTLFLEKTAEALRGKELVILSTGPAPPFFAGEHPAATFITAPASETMRSIIAASSLVIARAGYTSVMELFMMGRGALIIPTPGQTEQEYLGKHLDGKYGFITLQQNNLDKLPEFLKSAEEFTVNAEDCAEFSGNRTGTPGFAAGTRVPAHSADAGSGIGISAAEHGPDSDSSFAKALFEKTMDCLLEQNQK